VASRFCWVTEAQALYHDTGSEWVAIFPAVNFLNLPSFRNYGAAKSFTKAEAEAGVEPSSTAPSFVIFSVVPTALKIRLNAGSETTILAAAAGVPYPIPVAAKWKCTVAIEAQVLLA
jgi:hypothetical protein